MTSIEFDCPLCGQELTVEGKYAGRRVPCPACQDPITIPLTSVGRHRPDDRSSGDSFETTGTDRSHPSSLSSEASFDDYWGSSASPRKTRSTGEHSDRIAHEEPNDFEILDECPMCGEAVSATAKFCPSCGETLQGHPPRTDPENYIAFVPAPLPSRFGAAVIDVFLKLFAAGFLYVVLHILFSTVFPFANAVVTKFISDFLFAAFVILSDAFLESSDRMATPGKSACDLAVVDKNGEQLTFGRALVRNVFKSLLAPFCCISLLPVLVSADHRGLHDLLAGTYVVQIGK